MPEVILSKPVALKGQTRIHLPGERVHVSDAERAQLLRKGYAVDAAPAAWRWPHGAEAPPAEAAEPAAAEVAPETRPRRARKGVLTEPEKIGAGTYQRRDLRAED